MLRCNCGENRNCAGVAYLCCENAYGSHRGIHHAHASLCIALLRFATAFPACRLTHCGFAHVHAVVRTSDVQTHALRVSACFLVCGYPHFLHAGARVAGFRTSDVHACGSVCACLHRLRFSALFGKPRRLPHAGFRNFPHAWFRDQRKLSCGVPHRSAWCRVFALASWHANSS